MSDSQSYEEVTVSADGVTVLKRFEADEFPVPAIAFDVRSSREEAVTVRLRDAVPDGVAVEDLGFHPEYGSEHWTVDQETISFERELEAGADYTTVYGIRATGTDNIDQFLTEPTIAEVDPPLEDADGLGVDADEIDVVPGDDGALSDAITGDGEVPGLEDQEDDDGADDEEDVATLELDDPTEEGTTGTDEPTGEGDESDATDEETEPETADAVESGVEAESAADIEDVSEEADDVAAAESEGDDAADEPGAEPEAGTVIEGSLAAALAAEVREDNVPEEDLATLREALDVEDSADGSVEARVERIQGDVADLRAYTDALEEFLDENGTGQQVVEEAREEIDEFEQRLGEVEESVGRVESEVEDAAAAARDAGEAVGTVREDLQDVRADVDEVESELETFGADLEELDERVGEEDIAERVEEMEEELEDLRDWREQIMETFGG
jgi:archaellum component FlaC